MHGTAAIGERNGQAKLNRSQVEDIRQMRATGASYQAIANKFNVAIDTARLAAKGETWNS
jgi:DNA invertase Pin-like site-specific DNA recombinase